MKNILLMLVLFIAFSCKSKKSDPTPESTTVELTMISKLLDPSAATYIPLDSTRFSVYKISSGDTVLVSRKYTGNSGKVIMVVTKNVEYYIEAVSRTYKFTYDTQPHYYMYAKNATYNESTYNTFTTQDDFEPSYRITGYGCTNYYIQDPSE